MCTILLRHDFYTILSLHFLVELLLLLFTSGTRSTTRIIHAVMMDLSSTNSKPQTMKQWNSICRSRVSFSFDAAIMNGYNFISSNTWLSRMHSSRAFSRRWNTLSAQTCEFEIAHEELSKRSNPPQKISSSVLIGIIEWNRIHISLSLCSQGRSFKEEANQRRKGEALSCGLN